MKRREFLKNTALLTVSLFATQIPSLLAGRGEVWDIDSKKIQAGLEDFGCYDLRMTLPQSSKPGGIFCVSPLGNPLPDGVELTDNGTLKIQRHSCYEISGVIFNYEEPKV